MGDREHRDLIRSILRLKHSSEYIITSVDDFVKSEYRTARIVRQYGGAQIMVEMQKRIVMSPTHSHVVLSVPTVVSIPCGRGAWSAFYQDWLAALPPEYCGLYIEGVHSQVLDNWCIRHHWQHDPRDRISFIKLINCTYKAAIGWADIQSTRP
jgi:hypothetical protein